MFAMYADITMPQNAKKKIVLANISYAYLYRTLRIVDPVPNHMTMKVCMHMTTKVCTCTYVYMHVPVCESKQTAIKVKPHNVQ